LALVAHIAQANRKTSTDGTEFMDPAPKTLKASLGAIHDMEMKCRYFDCEEPLLLTRIAPLETAIYQSRRIKNPWTDQMALLGIHGIRSRARLLGATLCV
jgi:hypothetical protein